MASGWLARVARRFGEMLGSEARDEGVHAADVLSSHDVGEHGYDVAEDTIVGARTASEPERTPWAAVADPGPTLVDVPNRVVYPTPPRADPGLPAGVLLDENGRYVAGGYSFSTLGQALGHLERHSSPPAAVPTLRNWRDLERERLQPAPPPTAAAAPKPVADEVELKAAASMPSHRGRTWLRERTRIAAGGLEFLVDLVPYGAARAFEGRRDHSRIDPSLPVSPRGDPAGDTLSYWPSYANLDPRARWTYLDWVSRGRTDPMIPIGYVFLFFYGLEQRLLVDDERDEAEEIFAEVRRLLAIHGSNYSFQGYAARFLTLSPIYEERDGGPPTLDCASSWDAELPLDVRLRLGERLRDGVPFDADDALRWVLALPDVHLRTPGQRCFDELRALWSRRYAERHPEGLKIRTPKTIVRHEYRAASGTFNVKLALDGLPDVSGVSAPLGPLRAMLDACMEELSAYSRLLGRDPAAKGRLRGDLLLPAAIRAERASLEECRSALSDLVRRGSCPTAADVAVLLEVEIGEAGDKLGAQAVRQLGGALDALGYGFEPDRRYGIASALRGGSFISIFHADDGCPVDHERATYASAKGMVEVAMLAAASDGQVDQTEMATLERRLRGTPDLSNGEIERLLAHARALAADPPKIRSALKKLSEVAPTRRSKLAEAAIEAVLADGRVQPEEVRFLEALHVALGLPTADLYSALHRGAEDDRPVTVVEARPERDVALPAETKGRSVSIDTVRLERIRDETTRVSALLATIFTEDDVEAPLPMAPARAVVSTSFHGLDGPHSALLERLLDGPLARNDFEAVAAELRLMPEGAMETINEWGFDRFGEAVLEDDGAVGIVPEMMEELKPMGVAA